MFPSKVEISEILRNRSTYGELIYGNFWAEPKICKSFSIEDLLDGGPGSIKTEELWTQDILALEETDIPDVIYTIGITSLVNVDTTQLKLNATKLADIFFLNPDSQCVGELSLVLSDRSTEFTTDYSPGVPNNLIHEHIYVQGADSDTARFARFRTFMILPATNSAIVLDVLAYNLRLTATKISILEMIDAGTPIVKDLRVLWKSKITTDDDWLSITANE